MIQEFQKSDKAPAKLSGGYVETDIKLNEITLNGKTQRQHDCTHHLGNRMWRWCKIHNPNITKTIVLENTETPASFDLKGEVFADIIDDFLRNCEVQTIQLPGDESPQEYLTIAERALNTSDYAIAENIRDNLASSIKVSPYGIDIKDAVFLDQLEEEIKNADLEKIVEGLISSKITLYETPFCENTVIPQSMFDDLPKLYTYLDQTKAQEEYYNLYRKYTNVDYKVLRDTKGAFESIVYDNLAQFICPIDKNNLGRRFEYKSFEFRENLEENQKFLKSIENYLNDNTNISPML